MKHENLKAGIFNPSVFTHHYVVRLIQNWALVSVN